MAILISEENLPITLTAPRMTDQEFVEFCSRYPDCSVEVTADGEVIVMPRNYPLTAARGFRILMTLGAWAVSDGRGIGTDLSGGFVLPSGARRSPDAAWVSRARLAGLSPSELEGFWRLCPEFIIELRSPHDRLRRVRAKMVEWIEAGAELGWMIDPETRTVEIYRPNSSVEVVSNVAVLVAGAPVAGFTLELAQVWNPLNS
jgi:Uma2 family endonuclease